MLRVRNPICANRRISGIGEPAQFDENGISESLTREQYDHFVKVPGYEDASEPDGEPERAVETVEPEPEKTDPTEPEADESEGDESQSEKEPEEDEAEDGEESRQVDMPKKSELVRMNRSNLTALASRLGIEVTEDDTNRTIRKKIQNRGQ